MRHHNRNRKFGRTRNQRRALLVSLATALVERGRIQTTEAKAKELRPYVERLVTAARAGTLAARRRGARALRQSPVAAKLAKEVAPKYATRPGGYTRITKLPPRRSDGARLAIIEFV